MNRAGHALLIAILGLLLLEVVVAGTMAVGASERLLSNARVLQLRARLAAESGVHTTLANWDATRLGALPIGAATGSGSGSLHGFTWDATVHRLAADMYEVRASGAAGQGAGARASAVAIVSSMPRAALWAQFAAAAALGGLTIPDSLVADGLQAGAVPPGLSAAECPPDALAELAAATANIAMPALVTGPFTVPGSALRASGSPPVLYDPLLPHVDDDLAGVMLADVRLIADHVVSGTIAIAPVSNGATCDTLTATNWGVPNPTANCGSWLPLVFAPADLHVTSGSGQGVLVVDGNLTLDPGVEYHGAILATGEVTATDVRLFGALRAASAGPHVLGGAVRFNACALWRAFTLSPGVGRPFRTSPRWWIPAW